MYQNHNLRSQLQEFRNRLFKSNFQQVNVNFNFFFDKIHSINKLNSIIKILNVKYSFTEKEIEKIFENYYSKIENLKFENEEHHIGLIYGLLSHIRKNGQITNFIWSIGSGREGNERLQSVFENFVDPFVNYLHDQLDEDNTILYLLEKYKKRTEWFTKNMLLEKYNKATKSYEQILEDDLRMFLFEQGIEYPFSTPKSASGRADTVANLDTEEPLVLEIKIFDSNKNYKINRIKEGFAQIVKYSNDYNKNIGYLIIFNIDNIEIEYKFENLNNFFPSLIEFNNKFYYIITVNLNYEKSASKSDLNVLTVTEKDLLE